MDKLDQYAFPHRYQVDWYVYKTSGRVRQLREVTFSAVAIAERLGRIHGSDDDRPCLYGTFNKKILSLKNQCSEPSVAFGRTTSKTMPVLN